MNPAAIEGYYMIQGAPKLGGNTPAGTPFVATWQNLSEQLDMSGAPTYDFDGIYVAGSSDATGTSLTIQNSTSEIPSLTGFWNGVRYRFAGVPGSGTVMPDWDPVNNDLLIRGTVVSLPAVAANMWTNVSFTNNNVRQALGVRGLFVYYVNSGGGQLRVSDGAGTVNNDVSGFAEPKIRLAVMPGLNTGQFYSPQVGGVGATSNAITNSLGGFAVTDYPMYFEMAWGANSNTSTGPHTMKILWEYAVVPALLP